MRWTLKAGVGVGQPNYRDDVIKVQKLLNRTTGDSHKDHLKEDGHFGPKTQARIIEFQKEFLHFKNADAIVSLQGPTLKSLTPSSAQHNGSHTASGHSANAIIPNSAAAHLLAKQASTHVKGNKLAWINRVLPAARNVKARWGVPIAVTIAQGALESTWGTHAPGNMYFGIKGHHSKGKTVNVATHENYGKGLVQIHDAFRSYDTLEEAADDYGRFLVNNDNYKAAFAFRNDPVRFIQEVAKGGYATGTGYADTVVKIIQQNGLQDYDDVH